MFREPFPRDPQSLALRSFHLVLMAPASPAPPHQIL